VVNSDAFRKRDVDPDRPTQTASNRSGGL